MLCSLCSEIFSRAPTIRDESNEDCHTVGPHKHHIDFDTLAKASADGCRFCVVLFDTIELWKAQAPPQDTTAPYLRLVYSMSFLEGIIQLNFYGKYGLVKLRPAFALWPFTETLQEELGSNSNVLRVDGMELNIWQRTDAPQFWRIAQSWIDDCSNKHDLCRRAETRSITSSWYPTRLIDVYGRDKAGTSVSVRETAGFEINGRYMTVSHCWGGTVPIMLTEQNKAEFESGIMFQKLPLSFREAIEITRKLGIRYLWIDSLCIVQDSPNDWKHEASQMGSVYRNSWLNIATTGSENPNGGCFFNRRPDLIRPFIVTPTWSSDDQRLSSRTGDWICIDQDLWQSVESTKLNRRGWVIQERVLSPRQIHFSRDQLFYECCTTAYCETFPQGMPEVLVEMWHIKKTTTNHSILKRFAGLLQSMHDVRAGGIDPPAIKDTFAEHPDNLRPEDLITIDHSYEHLYDEIHLCWNNLVETYSGCGLSYSQDKLIALSGLAQEMSEALQTRWLAGLWEARLHVDLLWNNRFGYYFKPGKILREPSWTWVCSNKQIETYEAGELYEKIGGLMEANVSNDIGTDGSVCQGTLRMTTRLYPIVTSQHTDQTYWSKLPLPITRNFQRRWTSKDGPLSKSFYVKIGNVVVEALVRLDEYPEYVCSNGAQYMMLLLIEDVGYGPRDTIHACGLIVQPSPKHEGCFERIGTCKTTDVPADSFEMFENLWTQDDLLNGLEVDDSADGKVQVVTLV